MGNEAICKASFAGRKGRGKAQLETAELTFRSEDESLRFKVSFKDIKSAAAVGGQLRLETGEGDAVLELGANAAKWCDKILHPKSRIDKLGVKPGARVVRLGDFDEDFTAELARRTSNIKSKPDGAAEMIFFAANSANDLRQIAKLAKSLDGSAALWIVYPKGQKQLTETDVLSAGRKSGLKDVKVVGFSAALTALKFVIPSDRR
jgi:hypothetical protein